MPVDYATVVRVRQRFGDNKSEPREPQLETEAPFVGTSKEFLFETLKVDQSQDAILQFQSLGVSHPKNLLRINGTDIFGGLSTSVDIGAAGSAGKAEFTFIRQVWAAHSLLVHPNVLRDQNVLFIEARDFDGGTNGNLDNFIIDNVIVFYKTRDSGIDPGGVVLE